MAKAYSNFMKRIEAGKFVFTGELEPRKTIDITDVFEEANALKGYVTACNVTDNPGSNACLSSLAASHLIQEKTGMEVIYQLRCADRNRLALTSDLLGAAALGIKNILALTGDHTLLGDMPNSKAVFDLDSTHLIQMIHRMVWQGKDLNGDDIVGPRPQFNIGAAANPNATPAGPEILKVIRKIESGVDFLQTQVCFDIEKAIDFLQRLKVFNIPTLIGIFPMRSFGIAQYFANHVSGVDVPQDLLNKFEAIKKSPKNERRVRYDALNLEYFVPFIKELMNSGLCAGCHIMSVHYTELIPKLLKEVGAIISTPSIEPIEALPLTNS
jgi:methylenetetrahydrofolate reductase (NADPH)